MNNEVSITALMSSFGRAFHAENEDHPVFADHLAKELMTALAVALAKFQEGKPFFVNCYPRVVKPEGRICRRSDWHKAICYARRRSGYLRFSGKRILIKT